MKVGGAGGPAWPVTDYSQPVENRGADASKATGDVQGLDGVDGADPAKKPGQGLGVADGYEGATGATPATEALQDPKLQFPPDALIPEAGDVDGQDPARGGLDPARSGAAGSRGVDGVDGLDPAQDVDPAKDPTRSGLEDSLFNQQMEMARISGDEEDQIKNLQTWQGGGTDGRLDHFIKRMGLHSVLGDQDSKPSDASDATRVQAARDAQAKQDKNTDE